MIHLRKSDKPDTVIEIDLIAFDDTNVPFHAGTFKAEVPAGFFGERFPEYSRATFQNASVSIGGGRLEFRTSTRPKNRRVEEDDA